jgi:hypothetical protein
MHGHIFRKNTKILNFHENPSSGSRDAPCGRKDKKKLIVTFRNFAKAPKKLKQNTHGYIELDIRGKKRMLYEFGFELRTINT